MSGIQFTFPSPFLLDDRLYIADEGATLYCYDAKKGTQLWQYSYGTTAKGSPVYADGKIYCLAAYATTTVLAPGDQFEQLAVNKLDGQAQASPAIVDGAIFLRTDTHLYRIEKSNLAAAD